VVPRYRGQIASDKCWPKLLMLHPLCPLSLADVASKRPVRARIVEIFEVFPSPAWDRRLLGRIGRNSFRRLDNAQGAERGANTFWRHSPPTCGGSGSRPFAYRCGLIARRSPRVARCASRAGSHKRGAGRGNLQADQCSPRRRPRKGGRCCSDLPQDRPFFRGKTRALPGRSATSVAKKSPPLLRQHDMGRLATLADRDSIIPTSGLKSSTMTDASSPYRQPVSIASGADEHPRCSRQLSGSFAPYRPSSAAAIAYRQPFDATFRDDPWSV
jgi:hypothetical protein